MCNNRKCGRIYPWAVFASVCLAVRISLRSALQLHIIYIIGISLPFPSALHQSLQCAASAIAARSVGHRSALAFLHRWFHAILVAFSFCSRSLFPLCFQPLEISVPKIVNGDFGKFPSRFYQAFWGGCACWMKSWSKSAGWMYGAVFVRKNACCMWGRMLAWCRHVQAWDGVAGSKCLCDKVKVCLTQPECSGRA